MRQLQLCKEIDPVVTTECVIEMTWNDFTSRWACMHNQGSSRIDFCCYRGRRDRFTVTALLVVSDGCSVSNWVPRLMGAVPLATWSFHYDTFMMIPVAESLADGMDIPNECNILADSSSLGQNWHRCSKQWPEPDRKRSNKA